jgi:hypothetical protein
MAAMAKYLVFILSFISIGQTKYMEGELKTGDNWAFLARFCFLSLHGKFEYDIEYPEVRNRRFRLFTITTCLGIRY